MLYKQTFVVTGSYHFPVDMLRYDRCSPLDERDSSKIMDSFSELHCNNLQEIGIIRFTSCKSDMPTEGRWRSFGWSIKKGTLQTGKHG
jgi:hypothetical protein